MSRSISGYLTVRDEFENAHKGDRYNIWTDDGYYIQSGASICETLWVDGYKLVALTIGGSRPLLVVIVSDSRAYAVSPAGSGEEVSFVEKGAVDEMKLDGNDSVREYDANGFLEWYFLEEGNDVYEIIDELY